MREGHKVLRAWAALGRDVETRKLVQMAAACGVAVFQATGEPGAADAMTGLLDACLRAEQGRRTGKCTRNEEKRR